MCVTSSQRSPGNFTIQPFSASCCSGTSASIARANTSDIQVLVSVPRPPARFFFNAPHKIIKDLITATFVKQAPGRHIVFLCFFFFSRAREKRNSANTFVQFSVSTFNI